MIDVFSDIKYAGGSKIGALAYVHVMPSKLFTWDVYRKEMDGIVNSPANLLSLPGWTKFEFVFDEIDFIEKQDQNDGGIFFNIEITGRINSDNPQIEQIINTYRRYELMAFCQDKKGQDRLIGNRDYGLKFFADLIQRSSAGGSSIYDIRMVMDAAEPAPFYVSQ